MCKVIEVNTTGMYQYYVGNAQYMVTYERSRQTLVQLLHPAYNPLPRATPFVHKPLVGNFVFQCRNIILARGNTGFLHLTHIYILISQPCSKSRSNDNIKTAIVLDTSLHIHNLLHLNQVGTDTASPLTQTNANPMISIHKCIYTHIGTFQIALHVPTES